jgi:hypothetical protein
MKYREDEIRDLLKDCVPVRDTSIRASASSFCFRLPGNVRGRRVCVFDALNVLGYITGDQNGIHKRALMTPRAKWYDVSEFAVRRGYDHNILVIRGRGNEQDLDEIEILKSLSHYRKRVTYLYVTRGSERDFATFKEIDDRLSIAISGMLNCRIWTRDNRAFERRNDTPHKCSLVSISRGIAIPIMS